MSPDATRGTLERFLIDLRVVAEQLDHEALASLVHRIDEAPRLFVAGVGRSGAVMRAFATRLVQLGRPVHVVGDAAAPSVAQEDLIVIGSGSGATRTMIAVSEEARRRDACVAVVTGNALSPLGRSADLRLVIPPHMPVAAEPGESVLEPMQTVFEQALLLTLDAVSLALSPRDGGGAEAQR